MSRSRSYCVRESARARDAASTILSDTFDARESIPPSPRPIHAQDKVMRRRGLHIGKKKLTREDVHVVPLPRVIFTPFIVELWEG